MFRKATSDDLEPVLALVRASYEEDEYPFVEPEAREALRRLLVDPELGRVWVATAPEGAVAYVIVTLGYSMQYRGRDAFIDELYVVPGLRGRGLGREALAIAEVEARALGARALHLEVELDKPEADAWYRRIGFEDHARRLMTKWLEPTPSGGGPMSESSGTP